LPALGAVVFGLATQLTGVGAHQLRLEGKLIDSEISLWIIGIRSQSSPSLKSGDNNIVERIIFNRVNNFGYLNLNLAVVVMFLDENSIDDYKMLLLVEIADWCVPSVTVEFFVGGHNTLEIFV
jgi:hypothetical protein